MFRKKPPEIGQRILKNTLPIEERKYFLEGIEEEYLDKQKVRGFFLAQLWYWKEILLAIPFIFRDNYSRSSIMFTNYLKIAFRIIKRQKAFSLINLVGLTIGLTSCILIMLYVDFELGYDKFHENADNIYRVVMKQPGNFVAGSTSDMWVVSPAILKTTWDRELPDIVKSARTGGTSAVIENDGSLFDERFFVADPEFLDIFTFPLIAGDKETALIEPFKLILTERMALKYFGDEDPLGKTLSSTNREYQITGIIKDPPKNSHLQFDFILSFSTYNITRARTVNSDNWMNNPFDTYLSLPENIDLDAFDEKLRKYDFEGFGGTTWSFHVQPLNDIHFNRDIRGRGDIRYIYIFSGVGLLILFIACFNFINLSTARSTSRARELGIRKVVGAYKRQLIKQLLGESVIFSLISLILSVLIIRLILPVFSYLIGNELSFSRLMDMNALLAIFGLSLFVGLISGSYPAVILSSFKPVNILRGNLNLGRKGGSLFRNSLVVLQFVISIVMIVSTITLYNQLNFMRNKKLGYQNEHILTMGTRGINFDTFKSELIKNANISKVSGSSGLPTRVGWSNIGAWEGKDEADNPFFYRLNVDFDFMDLYGLEIINGREFSEEFGSDKGKSYILNEAAVKRIGWDDPIGQKFGFWEVEEGRIIGVVKDFHFESLHKVITPLGIGVYDRENFNYISVRINSQNIDDTIQYIDNIWKEINPSRPFDYTFIDEQLDRMYRSERRMTESFGYFTLIAIFIACLGLFGLVSFITVQKTKEIGIRKVLGANVPMIINLLSKEFVLLVIISNLFAWPLGWFAMSKWLETFAFRIDLSVLFFIFAGFIALLIALATISYQAFRAAAANPVDSLRYE
ncbi:MAG: FtsX-like permease family protein [bacterium]|nr:FtsX-like permease family protein [bacterium]